MRLIALVLFTSLLALGVAACGQKGPLYLPQPAEQPQEQKG
ncbi:MAG: lipoprotein [Gammaproteobacteria bacterium]|nr:lipoprotein [Pseudomaricurvus alcaniphilus]MBR9909882.1 lipoprotein [Gammaproteobacteria bacterium]NHN38608.1 lipoprotein [Pseudomaricurvus alcaniphilus]